MSDQDLSEFDVGSSEPVATVDDAISEFIEEVLPQMTEDQLRELTEELLSMGIVQEGSDGEGGVTYDAQFDLAKEIEMQLKTVHALRRTVMINNRLRSGVSAREVKDVVTTASTMLNSLMRNHEKLLNMDRQRALESATITVLKELGDQKLVDRFFVVMEQELDNNEEK